MRPYYQGNVSVSLDHSQTSSGTVRLFGCFQRMYFRLRCSPLTKLEPRSMWHLSRNVVVLVFSSLLAGNSAVRMAQAQTQRCFHPKRPPQRAFAACRAHLQGFAAFLEMSHWE